MFPGNSRRQPLRLLVLLVLVAFSTTAASLVLGTILAAEGLSVLEMAILVLFALLFAWITLAFWTAFAGFVLHLSGHHGHALRSGSAVFDCQTLQQPAKARTALIMPIYNEDPARVMLGIRATLKSLLENTQGEAFDLFILSDSTDPEVWLAEEIGWIGLRNEFSGQFSVYYRHRPENRARKSGNIADFCKSWGGLYKYMVILDADSIMSGDCLVRLVRAMQANPGVALIQVPPLPVLRESLFARSHQFAASVYGPVYAAGMSFWFQGGANYWGHNAIIRVEPFMAHCGLPRLGGREPFGGEILSHDFVEAALLSRAGWEVWLADDFGGSYEEPPPTLIDHAKRDRRWCQGNLQHLSVLFAAGLPILSRLHLCMGIMSYLSSVFWLLLLALCGLEAFRAAGTSHSYFTEGELFPSWPVSYAFEATTLLAITLSILYLPKLFGYFALFKAPRRLWAHGGALKAGASVLLESLASVLLAPVMMLFQAGFVCSILSGSSVRWSKQRRDDDETSWTEATAAHLAQCTVAALAGCLSVIKVPQFFPWLTPVLIGPLFAIPLSRQTSRVDLGRLLRRWGIFLTPAESDPPSVLRHIVRALSQSPPDERAQTAGESLFTQAVLDPFLNALHLALLDHESRSESEKLYLDALIARIQERGPDSLNDQEKRDLLSDSASMRTLHGLACQRTEDGPGAFDQAGLSQKA